MIFTRKDDTNSTTTVREITPPKKQMLVIIDPRVDNYHQLVSGTYPETKVVVLDVRKDGIEQITEALSDDQATSLHIVCHGADGVLYLGKTPVSQENIYKYRGLLQEWAVEEILLYGCNVGSDRRFLSCFHQLTGANIAASAHRVGNIAKGGSWQLSTQIGRVNSGLAFLPEVIQEYAGVLAVSFSEPTNFAVGDFPQSIVVGEFNGDGNLDLAVASSDVSVLLGNGDGTFADATNFAVGDFPLSIEVGEFNGDGNLDLAVANYISDDVSVLLGNGDGTFADATTFAVGDYQITSIEVGEFNGDGNLDLAVAKTHTDLGCCIPTSTGSVSVLLGNGDGTFADATTFEARPYPVSIAVGEFNGDGNLDLAVPNPDSGGGVSVLLGNGDGTFADAINFEDVYFPNLIAVGEFNGDDNLDLVLADSFFASLYFSVLLGNGDGTFAEGPGIDPGDKLYSIAVGEFNGDGNLDLALANYISDDVSVLLGNGDGSFADAANFEVGDNPLSIAVGEFNGDGFIDLAVANLHSDNVSILINTTGPPGTLEYDNLSGTSRNELIDGLAGNDTIDGAGGNDTLLGNTDDDSLDGGAGIDTMIGGPGNDSYVVDNSEDTVIEIADAGNDTVNSSITYTLGDNLENLNLTGNDAIHATGNNLDNTITGNKANNRLLGNDGNDTLEGRPGFDILLGGNGDDVLNGGIGRDRLNGGAGNDTLTGGASIDRFIFNTNQEFETSAVGIDVITDFDVQRDLILLNKKTFTALNSGAGEGFTVETDFAIVESDNAVATNDAFIVYNSASGGLFYNPNGNDPGLGDGAQFAVLNNAISLEANNFQIR